jgi:hypothetical protein
LAIVAKNTPQRKYDPSPLTCVEEQRALFGGLEKGASDKSQRKEKEKKIADPYKYLSIISINHTYCRAIN